MRYSQKDVSRAFIRFVRAMDLVGIKPAPMEWILEQGSVSNGIAYRIFWRDKATRERHNPGGLDSYLGNTAKEATNILDAMAATARWIAHNDIRLKRYRDALESINKQGTGYNTAASLIAFHALQH